MSLISRLDKLDSSPHIWSDNFLFLKIFSPHALLPVSSMSKLSNLSNLGFRDIQSHKHTLHKKEVSSFKQYPFVFMRLQCSPAILIKSHVNLDFRFSSLCLAAVMLLLSCWRSCFPEPVASYRVLRSPHASSCS